MTEDKPAIVAMPVEEAYLQYLKKPCHFCGRDCSISEESHKAISRDGEDYLVICIYCFSEKRGEIQVDKVRFTKGQMAEIADAVRSKSGVAE